MDRKTRERTYRIAARAVVSFGEFERWCLVQEQAAQLVVAVNQARQWPSVCPGLATAVAGMELALTEAKLMLSADAREQLGRLMRVELDNTEGKAALAFAAHGPLSNTDPAKVYDVATALLLEEQLEESGSL